jgi:hypothetical protein
VQGTRQEKTENERHLTPIQERELVKYVDLLTERGLPPTRIIIHNFVQEIAKKKVGKC